MVILLSLVGFLLFYNIILLPILVYRTSRTRGISTSKLKLTTLISLSVPTVLFFLAFFGYVFDIGYDSAEISEIFESHRTFEEFKITILDLHKPYQNALITAIIL